MIDLKQLAGRKYKIRLDESYEADQGGKEWYYQIECRKGHVYVHGKNLLGAYVKGGKMVSKVRAIPGTKIHQNGDGEATFVFPPELLDQVADVIQARRRPRLTDEQRAAKSKLMLTQIRPKLPDKTRSP